MSVKSLLYSILPSFSPLTLHTLYIPSSSLNNGPVSRPDGPVSSRSRPARPRHRSCGTEENSLAVAARR